MIARSRRCSAEFALAALGLSTHAELDQLVREGKLPRPTVEAPDFDFDTVNALASEREKAPR